MKSRLSSTIWTLVLVNGLVLFGVLWLAYNAGRLSNGASMLDFGSLPSGASGSVIFALFLVLGAIVFLAWRLNSSFVAPVQELAQFSERFATGDPPPRAHEGRRWQSARRTARVLAPGRQTSYSGARPGTQLRPAPEIGRRLPTR